MQEFFTVHTCTIQVYIFGTIYFHFTIYSPGNNIPRSKIFSFIILFHKCLIPAISQNASITPHCLRDQKCLTTFPCFIQCRRMKLYEFHILNLTFCAIGHRYPISGGYRRIGGSTIYLAVST